jgi:hypothetical protein
VTVFEYLGRQPRGGNVRIDAMWEKMSQMCLA